MAECLETRARDRPHELDQLTWIPALCQHEVVGAINLFDGDSQLHVVTSRHGLNLDPPAIHLKVVPIISIKVWVDRPVGCSPQ